MLAIRLNRTGKKNRAYFRVVVQEHTKAPGKRHVEIVGSYDPHKKTTILNKDRILYWVGQGAQVSDAVHNMLVREGVIEAKKIAKKMPRPASTPSERGEPVVKEVVAPVEKPKAEEVAAETKVETPAVEAVVEAPAEATSEAEVAPVAAEEPKA